MKKSLLFLLSICGLGFLNGCGSGSTTPPPPVVKSFSVTPANATPTAGVAFNITVTALDNSGQVFPTYSGTVHFTSSDPQFVPPANSTMANGTGTFSVTLKTAGPQKITATDTASLTGTSSAIPVSAAAPSQFSVTATTAASLTGATFKFTVTARDAFSNTATSYAGTVHFTSSDTNAKTVLPANSSLSNGTADFSAVLETVGSESITATDTVTPSITGTLSSIAVSAPAALAITNNALPDGVAGSLYYEECIPSFLPPGCPLVSENPLLATGGVQPYTWSWAAATGSSLPPGLVIASTFGCLSSRSPQTYACAAIIGTPSAGGTYNVVLTVTDSATPAAQKSLPFALTIVPKLVVTSGNPPDGVIGTPYNFTFTSSGGKPPVTWNVPGGSTLPTGLSLDASTGAISGTPTTEELSSFMLVVMDSGAQKQVVQPTYKISVNPPAVNNAELNGQYAFSFQGWDGSGPLCAVGSFTADGNGNLTAGLQDVNRSSGVTASQAFVGTYEIYADNRGRFNLKTSPGGTDLGTFRFAVGSIAAGVASKARFIGFDVAAQFIRVGGVIEKQDPTAFSTSKITGDYAFGVSSGLSSFGSFGAAGRFTAAAGSITAGSLDQDNQGAVNSDESFTGTYSVAANGRGTLTFDVTGAAKPVNAVFYVVSSGEIQLMSSDAQNVNSLFAGTILQQTGAGTFSNASLNGASVIGLHGVNGNAGNDVVLGILSIPSAGSFTLAADENNAGIVGTLSESGTYTAAANGRVTVTGTTHPLVLYLLDANKGFVVGTDSNASTGFFEPQTGGPFSTASANGNFFFGPSTQGNSFADSDDSGVETFNGAGGVSGTTDSNKSLGGLFLAQAFTDTYTFAASGRGTMTTSAFIFYVVSPSKYVLMDGTVGAVDATIEVGEK